MKKLTPRQWALYTLIHDASLEGGRSVTTHTVLRALSAAERGENGYTANPNGHDDCPSIWCDIEALNKSSEIEKIIVIEPRRDREKGKRGSRYFLAHNEEEAMAYIEKFRTKALKAFKRYWNLLRKVRADGQGKLISCQGRPIDEHSRAREFVEAFCNEAINEGGN